MNTRDDTKVLPPEMIEKVVRDRKIRTAITKESHFLFFNLYFSHYVSYPTASFQRELFYLTEHEELGNFFVVAFRGSGKSTILTMSYPIWAILGKQQKKFILILCQTQAQAKQHMMNLRSELEGNTLLKNDLGPFREEPNEWGSSSLVFSRSGARITAASSEQSIRGLRHNQYRPDLIIGDDVEDMASTKTYEGRTKTYEWLTSEVIPAGDRNTRIVIVGNLLHEDSLMVRLKEDIQNKKIDGIFKEYPLIQGEKILWKGKYPTFEDIEIEKRKVGNNIAWQREYLLRIVSNEDQAIKRGWIHHYDLLPDKKICDEDGWPLFNGIALGIDLAISKRDTADYTAMVAAYLFDDGPDTKMYILPNPINQRIDFPETVEICKSLNDKYYENGLCPTFFIEDVGYQKSLPQQLEHEGITEVHCRRPGNMDKRMRLALTAHAIKTGKILFPRIGAETLISQLIHFGVEKHDDLADAFTLLVLGVLDDPPSNGRIFY